MSRSYKKTPWCGDNKGKWKKRRASKAVRRYLKRHPEDLCQGAQYKKIYDSWDICDYYFRYSWKEYLESIQRINLYLPVIEIKSFKKEYRYWYQHYKGK